MTYPLLRQTRGIAQSIFATMLVLALLHPRPAMGADSSRVFTGDKSTWHGFDRYDYVMDDATLAITPFKAPANEGDGIGAPASGQHRCVIVVPKQMAAGNPWSWRG